MTRSKKLPVMLYLIYGLGQTAIAAQTISQQTTGDCSPAIIAQGNVSVKCGISTKALERLQTEVNEQTKKNAGQDVKLETLINQFQEFKETLSKRDDAIAKQAQTKLDDGDFEGAEALFKKSFQQHAEGVEKQQKAQAADAFALAQIKALQLNYPEAKTYYQQAVQLDPENALYLNELGVHLYTLGEYAEAESLYSRSLAIKGKALGKDHPDVAASLNNLAELYRTQANYDKAESLYLRSFAIYEKALGKDHPLVAKSLNNLAALYYAQGKYDKAESLYLRSLAIWEKALGKGHPLVATSLNNLADLYRTQGKYDKAELRYLRSLAIWKKALGKDHPDVAQSLNNLAALYYAQGKYDKAEHLYLHSLAIKKKALGKDHPDVATSINNLAVLYYAQGNYDQAELLYLRSLAIREKALGKDHPAVATSLNNLAALYYAQGKYDKTEPLYSRSLAILEKALGNDHPTTKTIRDNLQQLQAHLNGQVQVQVKAIVPDSQAEQLGIQAGDIFTRYNNIPILGMAALIYMHGLEPASNPAQELKVLRDGKELVFKVKPGEIGAELQEQVLAKRP